MDFLHSPEVKEKVRILLLTVCLLGLQFSWSVELGCGTAYLKKIGLSSAVTSLVWLAGPLSGLIMQPLVGAYSDVCTSRFGRRRPFMVVATVCSVFSCFMIGWAEELGKAFSSNANTVDIVKKCFAVFGFYLLDFAINAVQAACRALIIDVAGQESQEVANAWAGRMIGIGGLAGFFFGTLPLEKTFGGYLGRTQMQVICVLGSIFLCFFIGLTCLTTPEIPLKCAENVTKEKKNPFHALIALKDSWLNLPREAQQLCNVQFFAWIGWMPFYFYTSQWVSESFRRTYPQRMEAEINRNDEMEGPHARAGSLAMTLFSAVCLFSSFVMPVMIAPRGNASQNQTGPRPWWIRIRDKITLPRMYTASHLLIGACLLMTPLALKNVNIAIALPAIIGLSYAVTAYVPFVLLSECVDRNKALREAEDAKSKEKEIDLDSMPETPVNTEEPSLERSSQLTLCLTEVKPTKEMDEKAETASVIIGMPKSEANVKPTKAIEGGAILGIHNCYIVLPQFLTSLLSFFIFLGLKDDEKVLDANKKLISPSDDDGIGWVLRVGGVSLLVAAYLSTRIK